ncbi:hypothetical protein DY000_02004901 [Brassica cretica]|uniref:G-patch domain-containing protein n=1 Tax=Brassica cretica TaxID=69181 RepID=A0ABQ7BRQ3_BRACR|nr:hypothetical protein DY000_02004901 [Brassica cretica]
MRSKRRLGLGRKSDFEISEGIETATQPDRIKSSGLGCEMGLMVCDQYGIKRGSGLGCEMGQMGCEGD